MVDDLASELAGCDAQLPLLGVTREFDFGQFIELFDSTPDPNNPNDPLVSRIVIRPTGSLAADRGTASSSQPLISSPLADTSRNGNQLMSEPEVNLFTLTEQGPGAKLPPQPIQIADATFFDSGMLTVDGRTYKLDVDDDIGAALTKGYRVTAFADVIDPNKRVGSVPLTLSLPFEAVDVGADDVARLLAGGQVATAAGAAKPYLDAGAVAALIDGRPVLTHAVTPSGTSVPIELDPAAAERPLDNRFEVFDLAAFIAEPAVLGTRGERLPLPLDAGHIRQLLDVGQTELLWEGQSITLDLVTDKRRTDVLEFQELKTYPNVVGSEAGLPPIKPPGTTWQELLELAQKYGLDKHFTHPFLGDGLVEIEVDREIKPGTGTGSAQPSMTDKVQPRLPSGTGLPVAVFVPWKQTWTLKGFSRGNLLHSIAMAPLEEVTLQVFSWERRTRSLDQSSETEVDQATEVSNSTRDTEDVFKEMISKRDFAWQLSGSLDASYSNGVASISVGVDGSVSDTTSIQQTARNSSQHVKESTIKASARVRSRRVTRITQTVETGREERVTRVIRNPNQCSTLTLDFFEALAHYEIKLEFVPQRMRLVVLVPNPIRLRDFSSEVVRRNETTLRNTLIEPALVDGFDACEFVAAYEEAKTLLSVQQAAATKDKELDAQRDRKADKDAPDPALPQQQEVERIAGEMVAALKKIKDGADIDPAMTAIKKHEPVTEDMRRKGQYWLFINFCAAKFPAVLSTLDELAGSGGASIASAQRIKSVLPPPDAPTHLGNLASMSDGEKEDAGIASKIREPQYLGGGPWWAWWTGRMREEGLYTSNDAGLGGLAGQLPRAFEAWEAKKAQGAAMKDQETAKTEAEGRQDKASTDDKLAMAFPLDELARAYERQKVLRDHLNEHAEFYSYALFQALPPSEQALRIVEASNGRLQVGLFEPRVVAMNGDRLAVPLTPLAGSQILRDFVEDLKTSLGEAFDEDSLGDPDKVVLPTPGVTVSSRLGDCTGCEEYIEKARGYELRRLEAMANQAVWEATRRQRRVEGDELDPFEPVPA
jgi:hypothetical protein